MFNNHRNEAQAQKLAMKGRFHHVRCPGMMQGLDYLGFWFGILLDVVFFGVY